MVPLSVLDLAPIVEGGDAARALANSVDLARQAERWGYRRFWLAEHHNMPGIASAATAVAIGYVAEGTSSIRVGAGGIMLPNHAPLQVAEQFGTLEALFPGRIDLGQGLMERLAVLVAKLRHHVASSYLASGCLRAAWLRGAASGAAMMMARSSRRCESS